MVVDEMTTQTELEKGLEELTATMPKPGINQNAFFMIHGRECYEIALSAIKLAAVQRELIEFYNEMLNRPAGFLAAHNWTWSAEDIKRGEELRSKVEEASR